ncbi:MAG: orotidine-5'-phosphate decarboxylase [Candidatus Omnitrophota bacterium]|nr:orotidine-5'-phosphate decarboxylase [Candidatus Omnitrophota bacterium]MBU1929861.1 orotidine-5'-phosphate decarboxylase [Candidatus Omnitrophota bacterium]MBU2034662.1 orotidine-5'-phosphate decarboxylase [Candidatus Omnitrophota bacterium]MBU2221996.1 orotidine-5'-phosphate decarboxylase [Candidatus Omnitrophota bacterium]MBU2257617.1 orotidine-5'-phosphate decarboxylase [Candidatus Omnitrophota bacterium]
MKPRANIILALDVDTLTKARYFVNRLYSKVKIFKVGPHLFTAFGPRIVDIIHKKRAGVFLDLKFHDIPNTVSNAVRQAVKLKVKMLTLHISGGEEMLKSAVKAASEEARKLKVKRPLLVGVTVLTSQKSSPQAILKLAKLGLNCGLDGVVCSVREAVFLRKNIKNKFLIITPGIRADNTVCDDQKRTATASEAIQAGSDFLVVGRPILRAKNPLKAAKKLFK